MSSFDDIIQQKVAEHTAPVPDGAWEKIAGKKKKRRSFFWLWILLSLGLIGGGYWFINTDTQSNKLSSVADDVQSASTKPGKFEPTSAPAQTNEVLKVEIEKSLNQNTIQSNKIGIKQSPMNDALNTQGSQLQRGFENDKSIAWRSNKKQQKQVKGKIHTRQNVVVDDFENAVQQQMGMQSTSKTNTTVVANDEVILANNTKETQTVVLKDSSNKQVKLNHNELVQPAPLVTKAIKKEANNKPSSKWSFAFGAAPVLIFEKDVANTILTRSVRQGNFQTNLISTNVLRSYDPAFAFDFLVQRNFTKKLQLAAGLQYAQIKEHLMVTGNETVVQTIQINRLDGSSGSGVLVQDSVQTISNGVRKIAAINSYQLLIIPVTINLQIWQYRKLQIELNGGFVFHVNGKYQSAIQPALNSNFSPSSTVGVDGLIGLRLSRMMNQNWSWFVAPSLQANLQSPKISGLLQPYPLNLAMLKFGWMYRINNK
jgi:hypothetical protein